MLERKSVYTPQAVLNGRDHVNGVMDDDDTQKGDQK